MLTLETIADELRTVVRDLDPATLMSCDAARLAAVAAEVERLGAAAKVLLAQRAVRGNGWRSGSDAILPEQWYSRLSGCTESEARRTLRMSERLGELPATEARLREGSLSLAAASICAEAATADPTAESRLLRIAEKGELRRLRETKERVVAASMDEDEARQRVKRDRGLSTWTDGFSTRGSFQGPTAEVAVLLAALEPLTKEAFTEARRAGEFERHAAYRFDALIELSRRAMHVGGSQTKAAAPPVTRIRVDLDRLLAHDPDAPGEICEIPGVGPIPVAHARQVLPHGLLELVITNGVDVQTVVSTTRHVPTALKIAIAERDQTCRVEGCDRTDQLERHHTDAFVEHGITSYCVLGNLCPLHHDLVTYRGYTIDVNPDGSWTLAPPPLAEHLDERHTDAA